MPEIVIVGGGLAGLALADRLARAGRDCLLLEARDRPGGRIAAARAGGAAHDLGPSWFWPGQPLMRDAAARFGLTVFEQHATGAVLFEDAQGGVHRDAGFASMAGSYRIAGGMAALADAFAGALDPSRLRLGACVAGVSAEGVVLSDGERIGAGHVVLALPPRLAAALDFTPALPAAALKAMAAVPTWMAGQAKLVATYDAPFWRDQGLSGDAMSRHGPLAEIHDASPLEGGAGALFGFVGVPAMARRGRREALIEAATGQLARLFGPRAGRPLDVFLKDWALDALTAAPGDAEPLLHHPAYGPPGACAGLRGGRLHLASSEVAAQSGGFLEGALTAAADVAARLSAPERSVPCRSGSSPSRSSR